MNARPIQPSAMPAEVPLEHHDFRDRGTLEKVYPITSWQSWERRDDREFNTPGVSL